MRPNNNKKLSGLVFLSALLQLILISALQVQSVSAQNAKPEAKKRPLSSTELHRRKVNSGTLGIISGGIAGTYLHIATDLASVLDTDEQPRIRILPIAGKGGVRNIEDLMYMRGVDMAIVQSDVLSYIESNKLFSNVRKRVQYITKLYDSELHILANKKIKNIKELDGKKVNLWNKGSATEITAKNLFKILKINPEIVYLDNKMGIEKTQRGEIAATFLMVGKPVKYYQKLLPATGLHFLQVKYEGKLINDYLPAKFTSEDYPNLLTRGQTVSTLSTSAVLVVYRRSKESWRYKRVARFVDSFFENIKQFQKAPRHPKWKDMNIAANLPGWTRFPHAAEWIESKNIKTRIVIKSKPANSKTNDFNSFLQSAGTNGKKIQDMTPQEQEALFEKYLKWQKGAAK